MLEITTQNMKQLWGDSEKRRETVARRHAMMSHDWQDLVVQEIKKAAYLSDETKKSLIAFVYTTENLFLFAVLQLSGVYAEAPIRSLVDGKGKEVEDDLFEKIYNTVFTNLALDSASPLNFSDGTVGLRPRWARSVKRMALEVVPSNRFSAIPDPINPLELLVLVIQQPDESGFTVYTDELQIRFDKDFNVLIEGDDGKDQVVTGEFTVEGDPRFANPYGRIPFVIAHAQYPATDFWHFTHCQGLEQLNLATAISRAFFRRTEAYQSFLQLAAIGGSDDEGKFAASVRMSVDQVIDVPAGGDIKVLDLQADLQGRFEVIQQQIDIGLSLYGLNPDSYRKKGTESSGFALQLKREDQENVRKKQRTLWEVYEQQLYDVARDVIEQESGEEEGETISLPEGNIRLEWSPLGIISSPQEKWDLANSKIQGKVKSRLEYVMEDRGVSKEEAERILADIDLDDSNPAPRDIPGGDPIDPPPNPLDPPDPGGGDE